MLILSLISDKLILQQILKSDHKFYKKEGRAETLHYYFSLLTMDKEKCVQKKIWGLITYEDGNLKKKNCGAMIKIIGGKKNVKSWIWIILTRSFILKVSK